METAVAEQVQAVLIGQSSAADAMKSAGSTISGLIG
jgi:multiple sugar transport system substrate-binding protein